MMLEMWGSDRLKVVMKCMRVGLLTVLIDTLRSTFTADRKPRFQVCRLPPSCIKNRVITTHVFSGRHIGFQRRAAVVVQTL